MQNLSKSCMKVLDGGMGHLLRQKGITIKGEIGSVERFLGVALANLEAPELVQEAHEDYLKAGARVVTTNSYSCVPKVVGDDQAVLTTIQAAGAIARKAADKYNALVAGSLPPLNASYRPDLVASDEELQREYKFIAEAIASYSDVLLCETMSTVREAAAAAQAAKATGKPVWVSFLLAEDMSGNLMSGESLEDAVKALQLEAHGQVSACLFNCSLPECINVALPRLRAVVPEGVEIGGYANGFRTVKASGSGGAEYREDLGPEDYAEYCAAWAAGGATIIGGCCGIFPPHIAALAQRLKQIDVKSNSSTMTRTSSASTMTPTSNSSTIDPMDITGGYQSPAKTVAGCCH